METSRHVEWGESYHDIAMTPDGRFAVAWHTVGIVAQRLLPNGTPIGLAPW
jgi:hypothetical protein